jgi:hypothetical protein
MGPTAPQPATPHRAAHRPAAPRRAADAERHSASPRPHRRAAPRRTPEAERHSATRHHAARCPTAPHQAAAAEHHSATPPTATASHPPMPNPAAPSGRSRARAPPRFPPAETGVGANPTPAVAAAPGRRSGPRSTMPVRRTLVPVPAAASSDRPRPRQATASAEGFPSSQGLTVDHSRGHGAAPRRAYPQEREKRRSGDRAICRIDPFCWGRRRASLRKAHPRDPARGYRFGSRVGARTRRRRRDRYVNLASPRAPPRPRRQT